MRFAVRSDMLSRAAMSSRSEPPATIMTRPQEGEELVAAVGAEHPNCGGVVECDIDGAGVRRSSDDRKGAVHSGSGSGSPSLSLPRERSSSFDAAEFLVQFVGGVQQEYLYAPWRGLTRGDTGGGPGGRPRWC